MEKFKENFQPTTSTEIMLIGKIRQLEHQMYLMVNEKGIDIHYERNRELEVSLPVDTPRLILPYSARVRCAVNDQGVLQVRTEATFKDNPKAFGRQYFVQPEPTTPYQAEKLVNHLHEMQLNSIAHWLSNL